LKDLIGSTLKERADDMAFFDQRIDKPGIIETPRTRGSIDDPFVRLTYTDAINISRPRARASSTRSKWGLDMQSEHERFLTETIFKKPVIVTDYPKHIKAFYMKLNDGTEKTVTPSPMDILVPRHRGDRRGVPARGTPHVLLTTASDEMELQRGATTGGTSTCASYGTASPRGLRARLRAGDSIRDWDGEHP
jgi:aspartyl/asparaginyl-tRNA synthetase